MLGLGLLLATRVIIGAPFPADKLPSLEDQGITITLPAPGQVVVVELFATWCASCRDALPIVEHLRGRFGGRVTFVIVDEDDGDGALAKVTRFVGELHLGTPVALDAAHDLYARLGVHKLPTAYVVDSTGIVRHIDNGFGPGYEARLTRWIEGTLRTHEFVLPATRPAATPAK